MSAIIIPGTLIPCVKLSQTDTVTYVIAGTYDQPGIYCDDVSDLPSVTQFSGYRLAQGSFAKIISNNAKYCMQSDGTWVEQTESTLNAYYTRTETDAQITNAINDLDTTTYGGDGFYIEAIREENGIIVPTVQQLTNTVASGNTQPVTSRGVYSYVSPINEYLDYIKEFGVRNRMPQVKRVGTNNSNATPSFTYNGIQFDVNADGSITVTRLSGSQEAIVWLYDDFSAILADELADGSYYITTGFVGSSSTARLRVKVADSDFRSVSEYLTIPETGYSGMNISIIVYSGFTGSITIKPMFVKKFLYEADTAYSQYTPTPRECYELIQKFHP